MNQNQRFLSRLINLRMKTFVAVASRLEGLGKVLAV